MNGYILTFYTQGDRRHRGKLLADWLVHLAGEMNLRGATVIPASAGIGAGHHLHSMHFFELADQPISVWMAVTAEECDRLFARLETECVPLFYVKSPAQFGELGGAADISGDDA